MTTTTRYLHTMEKTTTSTETYKITFEWQIKGCCYVYYVHLYTNKKLLTSEWHLLTLIRRLLYLKKVERNLCHHLSHGLWKMSLISLIVTIVLSSRNETSLLQTEALIIYQEKKTVFPKHKNYLIFFFLRELYDKKFQGALLYCIILSNFSVEVVQSIETFGHCSPVFGTQTRTTHHDENGAIFSYKKEKKSLLKTLFTKATKGFRFKRSLF